MGEQNWTKFLFPAQKVFAKVPLSDAVHFNLFELSQDKMWEGKWKPFLE